MADSLQSSYLKPSPIGGYYEWIQGSSCGLSTPPTAAIAVTTANGSSLSDDLDLMEMIESELKERKFAPIVRLEIGSGMDPVHRGRLAAVIGLGAVGEAVGRPFVGAGNHLHQLDKVAAVQRHVLHGKLVHRALQGCGLRLEQRRNRLDRDGLGGISDRQLGIDSRRIAGCKYQIRNLILLKRGRDHRD